MTGSADSRPLVTAGSVARSGGALAGVRVLDFSWVWSGPMVGSILADLGAEVIKVEHRDRLDNSRLRGAPVRDTGVPAGGPPEELSPYFHQNNRSKLGITVDMKNPRGAELLRRLAAESDILLENLTPGVLDRAGLGFEQLTVLNPRLIMLSMSAAGQRGPLSGIRAYAPVMTALSGLESLVGYADEPTVGMTTVGLGDPNAASHGVVAVLAALLRRERTGRGQWIDMSQIEAVVSLLGEAVAEFQLAGRDPAARALEHPRFAPYGHFPCAGDDDWIAIAVDDDDEWAAVVRVVGDERLSDAAFASSDGRRAHRVQLDEALARGTVRHGRDELAAALRGERVLAAPVLRHEELYAEGQYLDRGLFELCVHPVTGVETLAAVPWRMSETQPTIRHHAPLVGQHTRDVLGRILDLTDEEVDELEAAGVLR